MLWLVCPLRSLDQKRCWKAIPSSFRDSSSVIGKLKRCWQAMKALSVELGVYHDYALRLHFPIYLWHLFLHSWGRSYHSLSSELLPQLLKKKNIDLHSDTWLSANVNSPMTQRIRFHRGESISFFKVCLMSPESTQEENLDVIYNKVRI